MDSDTIKVMIVKVAQAFNSAHQFVSDLTAGNIVVRSAALTGKTITNGVFNSNAVTFTAVADPGTNCLFILYKDTGNDATSPLIAYYDTGTNIPVRPNGGDITFTPD